VDGVEEVAEGEVAASGRLMEGVARALVVAVVREAAEVDIEVIGPVGVGEVGVEQQEEVAARRVLFVAEAGLVAAWEETGEGVVGRGSRGSSLVDRVDAKVGGREFLERNDGRRHRSPASAPASRRRD
jgi:hypothetical protein